jgi:bacterioferritin (cytochrome b1)
MAQVDSENSIAMPANDAGALYIPTDVTPEELFQAIGRLRKEARDEIDRLIRFLDKTDDYVSRELEDSIDDNP